MDRQSKKAGPMYKVQHKNKEGQSNLQQTWEDKIEKKEVEKTGSKKQLDSSFPLKNLKSSPNENEEMQRM